MKRRVAEGVEKWGIDKRYIELGDSVGGLELRGLERGRGKGRVIT